MYVMLTAGTTLSRFGVIPLNSPLTPSFLTVLCATSQIPLYVGGCNTVPWAWSLVRRRLIGYTTLAPKAPENAPMQPVANEPGRASSSWHPRILAFRRAIVDLRNSNVDRSIAEYG